MLSTLSRGYSSWNGELDVYGEAIEKTASQLPEVGPGEDYSHRHHKHGVTVTPRISTRNKSHPSTPSSYYPYPHHPTPPAIKEDGCLDLPKTFLTRKGALLLFSASDSTPEKDHLVAGVRMRARVPRKRKQQELIDLSLKLGTLERLSLSVLQYGDQNFDRENSSVSDKENRWFLKFLRHLDPSEAVPEEGGDPLADHRAQPGADLSFYLHDLKQRASSRCYGRESSLSSRARSQELREILQQLEKAWPSGQGQPLSRAPTSLPEGSYLGTDEFLYPRSPSLCSESSRAFSGRARVLSSHKLTASLKSLNYLARPSTDPGEQAPDPVIPHGTLSHARRSKSMYWSGTVDPSPDQRKHPGSSHHGSQRSSSLERQLMTTPDLVQGQNDDGSQAISVEVSSPMGLVTEGSDRPPMGSVVEEEMEGDRTSMSSSLQQEDDIILPSDGEDLDAEGQRREWMEGQGDGGQGLAKPLQPQYSGVLQDSDMLTENEEDKLRNSEQGQGSRPGSRAGSAGSMRGSREVYRPSSVMSSRAASRAGTLPEEEEEVDQEGLDELMAQGSEADQLKMDQLLLDHAKKQLEKQEKYAASYTGSVDRPEPDPETLISLQGGITKSSSLVKSSSDIQNDALQKVAGTPEPKLVDTPEPSTRETPVPGTPEPGVVSGTPEPKVAATPEPGVAGTPEPQISATPEPRSATPAGVPDEAKVASPAAAATPEPRAPSEIQTAVEGEATGDLEKRQAKSAEEMAAIAVLGAGKSEGKEETSADDADALAMAMSEAGTRMVSSGLLSSRSDSPALSATAGGDGGAAAAASDTVPASLLAVKVPVPSPLAEVKPDTAPKTEAKSPRQPVKKSVSLRQKSPPKGGKVEKKGAGGKTFVKAMDITSMKTDTAEDEETAVTSPKAKKQKESYRPPPPPPRVKTPVEKANLVIPEYMKEAMRRSSSVAQNELENELMEMHKAMEESLGLPTRVNEEGEGLTEEELAEAQQALKERMEEAQQKMQEALLPEAKRSKSPASPRKSSEAKPKKGKKVRVEDSKAAEEKAKKEAAKEQRQLERQKRLEEAKALQELISQKEQSRKEKEEEASRKAMEMEEQVEIMRAEEDAIQQAEEDAREQLAALRKIQREERETRRRADLEKKKQYALARREKEKKMMEGARKKEQEMLDRIADAEMRRVMREEEEKKRDEEERLAQERYEEELRDAQLQAEEEERRLQELERQAEEEAFQRIINEREEAERQREELEYQARKMAEEEERQRLQMVEEEKKLDEERIRRECEEQRRKDEEKHRLKELQRLEEEAREKMRTEIEKRRDWAMKRREVNLDRRLNLDGLRQVQGITEPWSYSYFIQWTKENYGRPMGMPVDKKKKPAKKKK